MGIFDLALGFGRITATSIAATTKEVLYQILGLGGFTESGDGDQVDDKRSGFGGVGLVSNPLPPEKLANIPYQADIVFLKQGDQLVPIAWRDLRLNKNFPGGIKQGSVALSGYGGGFYSLDLTPSNSGAKKANIHVLYCPFEFDVDGVPAKAHTIILDPTPGNESITITHSAGYQIALTQADGLMALLSADTFLRAKPGEFLLQAPKIMLKGACYLGAQAEVGIPLLAGPASPPGPSVFISPV